MKIIVTFLFFCLGVILSSSFTPKSVPVIKKTVVRCVVVHPNDVQSKILEICSQGFLLKHHIEKLGREHNASETKLVTLYFEK